MRLLKKFQFGNTSVQKIFPIFLAATKLFSAHLGNKQAKHVFCPMSV